MDLYETQVEEMTENLTIRLKQAWGVYKKPDAAFALIFFQINVLFNIMTEKIRRLPISYYGKIMHPCITLQFRRFWHKLLANRTLTFLQ